jgi:hypothetical protein
MRYRLRTLLVLLAVLPPLLAWTWMEYARYRTLQQQREALTMQFPVQAGRGLRVVVPAADAAPADPSNEQVFNFYIGVAR